MHCSLGSKMTRRDFCSFIARSTLSFCICVFASKSKKKQMPDRNCVVIVGAGPVGLVSAVCLARSGVPSVLLEASPTTPRDLRASTVHPPTLDMLDEIGVAKDYIKLGITTDSWQVIHLGTRERVVFDLSAIKDHTRHPYRLQCEQYYLAPILLE